MGYCLSLLIFARLLMIERHSLITMAPECLKWIGLIIIMKVFLEEKMKIYPAVNTCLWLHSMRERAIDLLKREYSD